jgi:hypothetical protein
MGKVVDCSNVKSAYLSSMPNKPIVSTHMLDLPFSNPMPAHNSKSAHHLAPALHAIRLGILYQKKVPNMPLSLKTSTPYVLQQTISLCQSVQGIVALAHRSYEAAEGIHLALACESAILVNLSDGDLDGGVVFSFDDAVGCAALARDVTEDKRSVRIILLIVVSVVALGVRTGQRVLPYRSPCWRYF